MVGRVGSGSRGPGFSSCSLISFFKRTRYSNIYLAAALSEKELGIKNLFAALLNLALGQKSLDQTRIDMKLFQFWQI